MKHSQSRAYTKTQYKTLHGDRYKITEKSIPLYARPDCARDGYRLVKTYERKVGDKWILL